MLATRLAMVAWLASALFSAAGCANRLNQVLLPNVRPEVRLTHIRLASPTPDTYAYLARWVGLNPAHRISHFVYAIDPVSVDAVDTAWVRTTATSHVLTFPRASAESQRREPHVFVVRAMDDRGEMSEPRWFAFTEDNLPPIVQITNPQPNSAFPSVLLPTVRIQWQGVDPDGQLSNLPVRYVYRLFTNHNPDFPGISDFISFSLTQPDSLRILYAPDFAGWNSVGGDTTSVQYTNLVPGSSYLFVITGFDEVGDYDPIFSANKNMLRMSIVFPGTFGPVLTMFNEYFYYTYPSGGWLNDVSRYVKVEFGADQPVTIQWFSYPPPGADIAGYRWVLDPADLADETPRSDEATDWHHWSAWSPATTSATVGPFNPPGPKRQSHLLFIEAEDSNGLRSLGIVNLIVVRLTFTDELLFVDDARLRPDFAGSPGTIDPPTGPWPTAAELDTFLFARGGFPWKSYPGYGTPNPTLSAPGIFNGYAYDTLGTRGLINGVPFSVLGNYRHVVWYTDEAGATYTGPPSDPNTPITALRMMSSPGRVSTLAAYVKQGGKVWLCGGGAALATLISWNRGGTSPSEYTARDYELVPGRMMYDLAHWREGVQMLPSIQARKFGSTTFGVGANRPGRHWPLNPLPPTPPAPPDYSLLPSILQPRNPATDPPPPLRYPDSFFYFGYFAAEYIHRPTFIREDYDDDPDLVSEFSTLDTLYITSGGTALPNAACMTYYHGRENQPFVFSGFNFWYWRRTQCVALVDWVLQSVWGLPRDPGAPREPATVSPSPLAARPGVGTSR